MVTDQFTVVHARAAGLDVHKMQITASIRIQDGLAPPEVVTREFSALPDGLGALSDWLCERNADAALMEATGIYWLAPFEALEDAGIPVALVNAHQVKQIKGRKTDVADSIWLARVCQFGLAQTSMVPPRAFRELRVMSRHRRRLIQARSSVRNRIHKALDRNGCRIGGVLTDIFGTNGRIILDGLATGVPSDDILASLTHHVSRHRNALVDALSVRWTPGDRALLQDLLREHDDMDRRINRFLQLMTDGLAPWRLQLDLLQTVPGIDATAAAELLIETGPDLASFANVKRFTAWAGVCPGNHESAGNRKAVASRRGSRHLGAILNQCAHAASRTKDAQFHGYCKQMTIRRGYKRALVATAHKLLRVIWAMFRDGKPYRDPAIDYEALVVSRNASRWLQQLTKHGYLDVLKQDTAANT